MSSERLKKWGRALGRNSFVFTRWIIGHMPYPVFKVFRFLFVALGYCVLVNKRKLAKKNLKTAFKDEKTEGELRDIANACFHNFGKGMINLIYLLEHPQMIADRVSFEGKENLDNALKQGNGAIMVSAHFGDFILMYLKMIAEGYPTNVIMRRTRDESFEQDITELRDKLQIKTIYDLPTRKCVAQCLKVLRNNEILFILLDQNYGSDGRVFVDFFGQKAATATGPIVFASRTNSPILPLFIMNNGKDQHKIVIEPPFEMEESVEDKDASIVRNIAKLTKIIEGYIRQYPHEWGGWMHNRWKSRSVDEQAKIDEKSPV